MPNPDVDMIVVGAGVAGLEAARRLAAAGRRVVVLDRARGVGGRCATRQVDAGRADLGPVFLHGHDPAFLAALAEVGGGVVWPARVVGAGTPCQRVAFRAGERRVVFAEGVSAFPKHLARGLDVRLETTVVGLVPGDGALAVVTQAGERLEARDVVLALALEQTDALLATLPQAAEVAGVRSLLGMFSTVPSLAVVATYGAGAPVPAWDVMYPEGSDALQLISNESSKRPSGGAPILVMQARPRWSRERLDHPPEQWARELLDEAARLIGPWAGEPEATHRHRWRYARLESGSELTRPLCLAVGAGLRVGVAGELLAPGGGVQGAWLSGARLAERLLQELP